MTGSEILRARVAERDALLEKAIALLTEDERVVAAWLHGSLGRGDADEWSDLDLWVIMPDEHIDAVREARRVFASRLGHPLVIVDAPQNAPPGGAFLSVVYEGAVCGPQHVDWTWQPSSAASIPDGVRLLFNRGDVPPALTSVVSPEKKLQDARSQTAFFWMMVPVVGKYIARRKLWATTNLLAMLIQAVEQIRRLVGSRNGDPSPVTERGAPPVDSAGQLALLRQIADEMQALMEQTDALTGSIQPGAITQAYAFLDLVAEST